MRLHDGLRKIDEGVTRCVDCGGEIIIGRAPDGVGVALTPLLGQDHACEAWQMILAAVLPLMQEDTHDEPR